MVHVDLAGPVVPKYKSFIFYKSSERYEVILMR